MDLQKRIECILGMGEYMQQNGQDWAETKLKASVNNPWFTPDFIQSAEQAIIQEYLSKEKLEAWVHHYHLDDLIVPKKIGIVMAGNIPMVGFHDFLSVFISGHHAYIKFSSKDNILLAHLIQHLYTTAPETQSIIFTESKLNDCDAIIATGNNQSALVFEEYFSHLPNIIRKNRTSVALLHGNESSEELDKLSDDIHQYFGLGCRNITKIYVPQGYDFIPLLHAFEKYKYLLEHHKYCNNHDYQLSILILNNQFYMSGGPTILVESKNHFSAIGILHYEYYDDRQKLLSELACSDELQCITGKSEMPFGINQQPGLFDYADGVDTMAFLLGI